MVRRLSRALAAAVLSLATLASLGAGPAQAQGAGVLPSDPRDFQCFVLLQERRTAIVGNAALEANNRVEIANNLTIISAFFAGRISHYSSGDAVSQFATARRLLTAATTEQRDQLAGECAGFYLNVMEVLAQTNQQATQPAVSPEQAQPR